MKDEMEGRIWSEYHHEIAAGIGRFLGAVMHAFCVLNAIEYSAPWRVISGRIGK
jgi:hypothetical protein